MDLPLITARSLLSLLILLLHLPQPSRAKSPRCTPSACGVIQNISFPFRLKGDPKSCGDRRYELACENDVTSMYLNSHKYYVKQINYTNNGKSNFRIRLVDASITNDTCSFPTSSLHNYNFTSFTTTPLNHRDPYQIFSYSSYPYDDDMLISTPINFLSCPNPLKNSSLFTYISRDCASNPSYGRYAYIKIGHMNASELTEMCRLEKIVMTSWKFKDTYNVSLSEIHDSLLYGFELVYCDSCGPWSFEKWQLLLPTAFVIVGLLCAVVSPPIMVILGFAVMSILVYNTTYAVFNVIYEEHPELFMVIQLVIDFIILAPRIIIFPFALWFLIYKFRRRLLSIYNTIEGFLQSDNKLAPIRYSYSDIKKMTLHFQEKIGKGGYSSVYKGKLRSGHDVAVKLLGKSKGNSQDFMNEIATIGRIHHVNVVRLVGYCAEGSKRALIFDFMPNGSLEKYIFDPEKLDSLNWDTKFQIVVGVAQGIKYLHQGCDIQILHFDIKPHNILLDVDFIPKVSDFGLAKYCSIEKNLVTLTAARGTIGYVAPELICRSIGAVSYKADVYSFGMLLIEMMGLKRDLIGNNDNSSQYFPYWIYDCFEQGKDIEIRRGSEDEENDSTTKLVRKMTLVALWCIQMNPNARPSMNKVLEMLEGNVEHLQIPNYPSQSNHIVNVDQIGIVSSNNFISSLHHHDISSSVEITMQE